MSDEIEIALREYDCLEKRELGREEDGNFGISAAHNVMTNFPENLKCYFGRHADTQARRVYNC